MWYLCFAWVAPHFFLEAFAVGQPWYLCASVSLILCLLLVEEFTPFRFYFSHSIARTVFAQLARFPPTALGFPHWGCLTFCCFFLVFPLVPLFLFFLLFVLYLLSMPFLLFLLFLLYSCSFVLTYSSVQKLYLLAFVRFFFSSVFCQVRFEYDINP